VSILWTRRRWCVDEDVGEDHVDEDLGDEVSALVLQQRVDNDASLGGVPRGNKVSMPCRAGEVGEELHLFPHRPNVWVMHVDVASGSMLDEDFPFLA
jgi:hypothetical protein